MTLLQLASKLKCTFCFYNILCSRYNNTQHKPAAIHDLCCLTDLPFETVFFFVMDDSYTGDGLKILYLH